MRRTITRIGQIVSGQVFEHLLNRNAIDSHLELRELWLLLMGR